jgi:hypothetical protein
MIIYNFFNKTTGQNFKKNHKCHIFKNGGSICSFEYFSDSNAEISKEIHRKFYFDRKNTENRKKKNPLLKVDFTLSFGGGALFIAQRGRGPWSFRRWAFVGPCS